MARLAGSDGKVTAKAILMHSRALIAKHGYAAVSMRMIAEAVGVQAGALYQYHATKQQLLVCLMRTHMQELLEAWREQAVASDSPTQALDRFVHFHIRYNIIRPDEIFIAYMELRSLEPEGFEQIEKLRREYEGVLKTIISNGIKLRKFNCQDAHVAAMAILAMLIGVNTWYRSSGRLSQSKIEDMYAKMILQSVGCTENIENIEMLNWRDK